MLADQSSAVNWVNGFAVKMPALLTSVSMRPKRSTPSRKMRSDRARIGDDAEACLAVGLDEGGADAAGGAGDDGGFRIVVHGERFLWKDRALSLFFGLDRIKAVRFKSAATPCNQCGRWKG
jgi:hypothetical protein